MCASDDNNVVFKGKAHRVDLETIKLTFDPELHYMVKNHTTNQPPLTFDVRFSFSRMPMR